MLLTRSPLIPQQAGIIVRLACVKHAASVHPEPGSNSPLKKNRHNRQPPGKREPPAAQNLKPAVKTRPHHGVAQSSQFNQSITINWYQQTWHTIEFSNNRHTRHHHNHHSRRSLRSNFPNLPGPGPQCKSRFQDPHQQPNQPHPNPQRTKRQPDPGLENFRGLAASGSKHSRWSPSRRLRKQYTHPTPTATPLRVGSVTALPRRSGGSS